MFAVVVVSDPSTSSTLTGYDHAKLIEDHLKEMFSVICELYGTVIRHCMIEILDEQTLLPREMQSRTSRDYFGSQKVVS